MDTKEKIVEALDKNGISNIQDAIDYLSNCYMDVFENKFKWDVETSNGIILHFKDDEGLIDWAREERDKIEGIKEDENRI